MPIDEPNEEKPRVYQHEGNHVNQDPLGEDKADISRMAEDEVTKSESLTSTASTSSCPNGARTSGGRIFNQSNGSLNLNSASCIFISSFSSIVCYRSHVLFRKRQNCI